jgi:hypothetical protein
MSLIYRNKSIFNQRGGSIDIDNTTDQEKVKLSHRSGSNVNITNVVTSELATNNKQTNIVNDLFETVGGDTTVLAGKNRTIRTGENTYNLKGFIDQDQLTAYSEWKDLYSEIAKSNSQFKIQRGGVSLPNGVITPQNGNRRTNPTLSNIILSVDNTFTGYRGIPMRKSDVDDVVTYSTVPDHDRTVSATYKSPTVEHVQITGTNSGAPGILEFGASVCAATEQGTWTTNTISISEEILKIQDDLTLIESRMGNGGDDIEITKRHKFEQVGAIFNDYPSVRIDEKGRSQPLEMLISPVGAYKNHDYVPHVEDVDNASNFPCGNDDKVVGNRYSRKVGSGGIDLKTTGPMELGGTTLKAGFKKIHLNSSHGVQISSEEGLELQSIKTIVLRTNRQVYVESSLGINKNLTIGGGQYTEGEVYLHHVTAPLEVHQTQDTTVLGKFATDSNRRLVISETLIGGVWYPSYALADDDLIINYPHSHHHNGIPMRLTTNNEGVRLLANSEGMNSHNIGAQALPQIHERKAALRVTQ